MIPTLLEIDRHRQAHGGLWLVVPEPTGGQQPRPFFVLLEMKNRDGRLFATYDQGDFAATVDDSTWLRSATWTPVSSRGELVPA